MASGVKVADKVKTIYDKMKVVKNDDKESQRIRVAIFKIAKTIDMRKIYRQEDLTMERLEKELRETDEEEEQKYEVDQQKFEDWQNSRDLPKSDEWQRYEEWLKYEEQQKCGEQQKHEEKKTPVDAYTFFERLLCEKYKNQCCYLMYDAHYQTKESSDREDLIFIMWIPDDAKCKPRMIYSSSKSALTNVINQGLKLSLEAHEPEEIKMCEVAAKLGKNILTFEGKTL